MQGDAPIAQAPHTQPHETVARGHSTDFQQRIVFTCRRYLAYRDGRLRVRLWNGFEGLSRAVVLVPRGPLCVVPIRRRLLPAPDLDTK